MKINTAFIVAASAVAGMCAERVCAGPPETLLQILDVEVPALLREYNVPGIAIALVEDTTQVTVRTFGSTAANAGPAVTAGTLFNVGSISKTFTAWGVMRAASANRIDIDVPVERYLTRWHFPPSAFDDRGVTLRRLLSHTAGVSLGGYMGWPTPSERPSLEASLGGATNGAGSVQLMAAPGSRWSYSGGGYTVAQLAIEEQVGQPFERYYDSSIFPAMGLTDTHFIITPELIARSSRAHDLSGAPVPMRTFTEAAAAGLSTTIEDMGRLVVLTLRRGVLPDGEPFLLPDAFAALIEPQVAAMPPDPFADVPRLLGMKNFADGTDQSYGLGYHIYKVSPQRTVVGHTGATLGWRAGLFASLESGQGIAIATNADGGRAVRDVILCYWARHLSDRGQRGKCAKPASTRLQILWLQAGTDRVLAEATRLRRHRDGTDFGETTLIDVAYSIADEAPDETQRRSRLEAGLRLLQANAHYYPRSSLTRTALERFQARLATEESP